MLAWTGPEMMVCTDPYYILASDSPGITTFDNGLPYVERESVVTGRQVCPLDSHFFLEMKRVEENLEQARSQIEVRGR